jgi:hypothetical protein
MFRVVALSRVPGRRAVQAPTAVLGLFTTDASYRSHPLRPAHTGHDGVAAYWTRATADQVVVHDP